MAELADAEDLKSSARKSLWRRTFLGTSQLAEINTLQTAKSSDVKQLVNTFLASRRKGLSPLTMIFYAEYLTRSQQVIGVRIRRQDITNFLTSLTCTNGGKHAYYRTLSAFYNWLYSPKSGYNLEPQNNPVTWVDSPKVERKILPSLLSEQVNYLIEQANCTRDKAIVSLLADSGLRLAEVTNINPADIDWEHSLIKVTCKGNKEGFALFGEKTQQLLKQWLCEYRDKDRLWDMNVWGITSMLQRLEAKTGLPCNAHTFRRTFASVLAKRGVDALHIMRLGRWETLAMVEHYTRSVKFQDSMKFYGAIAGVGKSEARQDVLRFPASGGSRSRAISGHRRVRVQS